MKKARCTNKKKLSSFRPCWILEWSSIFEDTINDKWIDILKADWWIMI